eukprot:8207121-Ditylum_brightwellii.AAC.1
MGSREAGTIQGSMWVKPSRDWNSKKRIASVYRLLHQDQEGYDEEWDITYNNEAVRICTVPYLPHLSAPTNSTRPV